MPRWKTLGGMDLPEKSLEMPCKYGEDSFFWPFLEGSMLCNGH